MHQTDHGQDHTNDRSDVHILHGQAHSGRDLATGNLHTDNHNAVVNNRNSEDQEQDISHNGISSLNLLGHKGIHSVYADVLIQLDTIADADVNHPDKQITGKLFRPGEGVIQNITEKDLQYDNSTHQCQKDDTKNLFQMFIEKL